MFGKVPETKTAPLFTFTTASCSSNPGLTPTNPTGSSFVFGENPPSTKEPLVFASSPMNPQSQSFLTRMQQLETKVKELEEKSLLFDARGDAGKHDKEELLLLFQNYMVAAFKLINCLFSMAIAKISKLRDTDRVKKTN